MSDDKTITEEIKLDSMTYQHGLKQILKEPTYISDSHSSCIDLVPTSQPKLSVDSGIHTLHGNCNYETIYRKFDLKKFYPSPHERTILHYEHANIDLIKKAIDKSDCKKAFEGCDLNKQLNILIDTVFNIMSNFIPNETILSMIEMIEFFLKFRIMYGIY